MKFGEHIKGLRAAKELGLRELALKLDVDATYLSRVERDVTAPPSEDLIVRIAHALGEDPDVLLGMAGKVSREVQAVIAKNPQDFVALIKAFKNASSSTIQEAVRKQVRDGEW